MLCITVRKGKLYRMHISIYNTPQILWVLASILYFSKTTAAQNEVALSYHKVRGLYFLAVVFVIYSFRITNEVIGITTKVYACGNCDGLSNCKACTTDLCNGALSKVGYTLPLVLVAVYLFY